MLGKKRGEVDTKKSVAVLQVLKAAAKNCSREVSNLMEQAELERNGRFGVRLPRLLKPQQVRSLPEAEMVAPLRLIIRIATAVRVFSSLPTVHK